MTGRTQRGRPRRQLPRVASSGTPSGSPVASLGATHSLPAGQWSGRAWGIIVVAAAATTDRNKSPLRRPTSRLAPMNLNQVGATSTTEGDSQFKPNQEPSSSLPSPGRCSCAVCLSSGWCRVQVNLAPAQVGSPQTHKQRRVWPAQTEIMMPRWKATAGPIWLINLFGRKADLSPARQEDPLHAPLWSKRRPPRLHSEQSPGQAGPCWRLYNNWSTSGGTQGRRRLHWQNFVSAGQASRLYNVCTL